LFQLQLAIRNCHLALVAAPINPTKEYIYSGGLLASIEGGTTKYYLPDHLSNRMTANSSGSITNEQGHFPFGESWYGSEDKSKFTTYERDIESGNDHAMFRSYVSRRDREY
jgi:hypothetical protein